MIFSIALLSGDVIEKVLGSLIMLGIMVSLEEMIRLIALQSSSL